MIIDGGVKQNVYQQILKAPNEDSNRQSLVPLSLGGVLSSDGSCVAWHFNNSFINNDPLAVRLYSMLSRLERLWLSHSI
jgi:hypothetical protein